MKSIVVKELFRTIKRTFGKFVVIGLIISLGFSTLIGILFAQESMKKTGDNYFDSQKFHNVQLLYPYGFSQNDINEISKLENVDEVEGLFSTTGFLSLSDKKRLITIQSVTEKIDLANVIEGKLPSNPHEIAIEKPLSEKENIHIGDEIEISNAGEQSSILGVNTFKVVGIVSHPSYISNYEYGRRGLSDNTNGICLNFVIVSSNAFNISLLGNSYTEVLIYSKELEKLDCFSDKYKNQSQALISEINILSQNRKEQYNKVVEVNSNMNRTTPEFTPWITLGRESNASFEMYQSAIETLGKISVTFSFAYILVAMMVCYSFIGRIIIKHKRMIGTQLSYGFKKIDIIGKYAVYAFLASLFGSIGGIVCAVFLVEDLTLNSYKQMYIFNNFITICNPVTSFIVVLAGSLLMVISAVFACTKLIGLPITELLSFSSVTNLSKNYKYIKAFKNTPVLLKAAVRSLMLNKLHFITNIIGVAGCTILLVTSLTLKYSISDLNMAQFEDIIKYDFCLITSCSSNEQVQPFKDALEKNGDLTYIDLQDKMFLIRTPRERYLSAEVICADSTTLSEYLNFRNGDKKQVKIPNDGIVIDQNFSDKYNVNIGDYIEMVTGSGKIAKLKVNGFFDNYVNHYILISPEYYKLAVGEPPIYNVIYINSNGENRNDIQNNVQSIDGFISISGKEFATEIFNNISDSLNSVISILIFLSGIMALLVIMNILIIYIHEKERELAIMRVNGFSLHETKSFVYYNYYLMCVLGLIVGIAIGILLGYCVVMAIENDSTCFVRNPSLKACFISAMICGLFCIIVERIASLRIKKIPLTNVNDKD